MCEPLSQFRWGAFCAGLSYKVELYRCLSVEYFCTTMEKTMEKSNTDTQETDKEESFDEMLEQSFPVESWLEPLDGQLEIESKPNRGTTITNVVPLDSNFEEQ